jgi:hypothetical protein
MKLIYYTPPGAFLIVAVFDDLLDLLHRGFYCCRGVEPYTRNERYEPVNVSELRKMWAAIQEMDQVGKWTSEKERLAWNAHYLTTRFGLYRDVSPRGIAGVVEPCWHFPGPGPRIQWDVRICLHWNSPLSAGALRLIEMSK